MQCGDGMTPPADDVRRSVLHRLWTAIKGIRPMKSVRFHWIPLILLGVVWVATVGGLAAWGIGAQSAVKTTGAVQQSASCAVSNSTPVDKPVTLVSRGSPSFTVPFGRDFATRERRLDYDITDPAGALKSGTCVKIDVGPFLRDAGDTQLSSDEISATANVDGKRLVVDIKFVRTGQSFAPAGTYTGIVSIDDPRINDLDIPLTVTLEYPVWQLPLALAIAMILPATIYLALVRRSFLGKGPAGSQLALHDVFDHLNGRNGILAIGAGSVGAVGIYTALYLSSSTWGTGAIEWIGLAGAAFTAFGTAATTVAAAGSDSPG